MNKYRKTIDEAQLRISIERRFEAPKKVIWDYYTKPEMIEQWWGPEGYPTTIKTFDLRAGGAWHYCMTGPDGTEYWSLVEFKAIEPGNLLEYEDYFSDETGVKNSTLPATRVRIDFQADSAATVVSITLNFAAIEDLRKLVEMGFEQGYASQCEKLDKLLADGDDRPVRIVVGAKIDAPVEDVWRAYTTPEDIMRWNSASDDWHTPRASVDLQVGGAFSSRMEARDGSMGFDFEGTYTKIVENKLIEYSFGGRAARVQFSPAGEGVYVRVTFDSEAIHSVDQQRDGWQAILSSFKKHVERANGATA